MDLAWLIGLGKGLKENPLGVVCALLVGAVIWLSKRLTDVQEKRVLDAKEEKERQAVRLDKNTEAIEMMLEVTQARAKRRRASDAPTQEPAPPGK